MRVSASRIRRADASNRLARIAAGSPRRITHAALDAADELRQHAIHRSARFLERLDAFGRDFCGDFFSGSGRCAERLSFHSPR